MEVTSQTISPLKEQCKLVMVLELLDSSYLMNLVYWLRNAMSGASLPLSLERWNLMFWSTGWHEKGLRFTELSRGVPVSKSRSYGTFGLAHAKDLQYFYLVMRALKTSSHKEKTWREGKKLLTDSFQGVTALQWHSKLLWILTFSQAQLGYFFSPWHFSFRYK